MIDAIFHCKIEKTGLRINALAHEVPEYYWADSKRNK